MSQCERCKGFFNRYFEEHSSSAVEPRIFCPICVIVIAGGYLCKAQQRKVQQARYKTRRPQAPEITQ